MRRNRLLAPYQTLYNSSVPETAKSLKSQMRPNVSHLAQMIDAIEELRLRPR